MGIIRTQADLKFLNVWKLRLSELKYFSSLNGAQGREPMSFSTRLKDTPSAFYEVGQLRPGNEYLVFEDHTSGSRWNQAEAPPLYGCRHGPLRTSRRHDPSRPPCALEAEPAQRDPRTRRVATRVRVMADSCRIPQARALLQQCLHARLQVRPAEGDAESQWVEVQRGLVIYVCFFKGANKELLPKMVNTLLNVKLSEAENGKHVSILDLPGNVLIIPQATLGGRVKGRNMQYHSNSGKEEGLELYSQFVTLCEKELAANSKCVEAGVVVEHGTYGNRQVLKLDTNGPYTHLIEF